LWALSSQKKICTIILQDKNFPDYGIFFLNIPIADTGDCSEGVTITVIGVLDIPPVSLTTTSINLDDSELVNCPDANSTTNTSIIQY